MFYMHNFGWGWWLVMSIGMVAFWALVIYGIIWLVRGGQNVQQRDEPSPESPRQILKRRLAQGEISVEEYERVLETLDDQPSKHSMAA
jgi:putative membrane protein